MQKFGKKGRLCKKTEIERLFKEGSVIEDTTFTLMWLILENSQKTPIKFLISVPKKNIKASVSRNKIKRLVREVYRKENTNLENKIIKNNQQLYLAFIYKKKEIETFSILEQKIKLLLLRLTKRI
ncbi:MAG: ribonuclease P protein component [Bacteroidota bacterium]|nr:ribonuclease P protein component [Bacteroidota bacterium]